MERSEATHMLTLGAGEDRDEVYLREDDYGASLLDDDGDAVAFLTRCGTWDLEHRSAHWDPSHPVAWRIEEVV